MGFQLQHFSKLPHEGCGYARKLILFEADAGEEELRERSDREEQYYVGPSSMDFSAVTGAAEERVVLGEVDFLSIRSPGLRGLDLIFRPPATYAHLQSHSRAE